MDTEELIKQLEIRKAALANEMRSAQQQAMMQAALPFQTAIGEIDNVLALVRGNGQTPGQKETPPS